MDKPPIPIGAMFLGPKSENASFFLETLTKYLQDHIYWRRNFHPEDLPAISAREVSSMEYQDIRAEISQSLFSLTSSLKKSMPSFSPRYLGHMCSDVMLPAALGYIVTLLYNPNNVSWEASPVTSQLEKEVIEQMACLMGFNPKTWGHITSGGTIANLEAIWIARNIKYHTLSIIEAAKELDLGEFLISGKMAKEITLWQAMNVPITEALDLTNRLIETAAKEKTKPLEQVLQEVTKAINKYSIRTLGIQKFAKLFEKKGGLPETVVVIPQTKHYSWMKGPEIFGLGTGQIVQIPVNKYYRQDMQAYKDILENLCHKKITPIVSVAVCGTTEEGAVDQISQMLHIREEMKTKGLHYWLHCDAAWGGYIRTVFIDSKGKFKTLSQMQSELQGWPSKDIYDSFKNISQMDSITIDPHKLGYIPYPAGAIIFQDIRMREQVSYTAPYALGDENSDKEQIFFGRYIMEGSKPGAAAAAVWLSNQIYPLNELGYGNLIGKSIVAARSFADKLCKFKEILVDYELVLANFPIESNIVCYFFNPANNKSLEVMNQFNRLIFEKLNVHSDYSVYVQSFYISHTKFYFAEYNFSLLQKLIHDNTSVFINEKEQQYLTVLRSVIMNPFLDSKTPEGNYLDKFIAILPQILDKTLDQMKNKST